MTEIKDDHKDITLFPCSGLRGFNEKNHIYRAKSGVEKEGAINNPTLAILTIEEATSHFANATISVSHSHTICPDCKQRDREINADMLKE